MGKLKNQNNYLMEIFRRRELLIELTKRQLTISHKGSFLGLLWIVLNPLLLLGLYVLVFGFIFKGKIQPGDSENRLEYGITIFMGLTVIHFLTEVLASAPRILFAHANYLQRTNIPAYIIPMSTFFTAMVHFLVSALLLVVGLFFISTTFTATALWAIPILSCLFMLGLGLSWMLASLGTFFRDISEMMPSFSMAILFGSAVFYPVDQIPESIWRFLKFNPILHVVNELRSTVLWQNTIDMSALIYIAILSLSFLVCGWFIFHLTRHKVSEIV